MKISPNVKTDQNFEIAQYALDRAQDAIFGVDEDAQITYVNEAACQHLGYSRNELLTFTVSDFDPDFSMEAWGPHWDDMKNIGWRRFETNHKRKDGTFVPVEVSTRHMAFKGKDICLAFIRCVAQRQEIERNLKLAQFSLEYTRDCIFRTNDNAQITYVNNAACQHLGYSKDELLKLTIPDIDPDFSTEIWHHFWRKLLNEGGVRFETRHKRKDGTIVPVEIISSYIEYDGEFYAFASVRDISERKQVEIKQRLLEEQQRDVVVREVHHRIKNNLQGMIGLIGLDLQHYPEATQSLQNVIGKIKSVAVVFGLQGQRNENDIRLCEVAAEICKNTEGLTINKVEPLLEVDLQYPIRLTKDKSVPVALIVNELVTNALKHGYRDEQEPVRVRISSYGKVAILRVQNKCPKPPKSFNFERNEGIGTGLSLIRSMLSFDGSELSLTYDNGTMTAELRLIPPIIILPEP